jgi:hypothetical protein
METGMVADPFRRGNGDRALPSCLAVIRATCVGIIVLTFASCAKDVQQRTDRVAERQLPIPRHASDAARPSLFQRTSDMQRTPPKEANRNEALGNTPKARLPLPTSVSPSPRPRSSEKLNVGPLTPAQKERLFEEFLQWQKRTTIQGILARADDTNEAVGNTSNARLPLATSVSPSLRPRSSEKFNLGLLTTAQKERLFEEFSQWQKTTTLQGILAMTDDTKERYAIDRDMP